MDEKEIAREILRQQWGCEGAIWKALPLEVVQEWGEDISYWLEIANLRAAHAIAEKLREGVVLEESAYVYLDPNRDSCRIVFPRLPGHGEYAAETVHVPSRITDETGQRVTVTVTKVEP